MSTEPRRTVECPVCLRDIDVAAALLADHFDQVAARYPAEVFSPDGTSPDAIAGTAIRVVLTQEAKRLRGDVE